MKKIITLVLLAICVINGYAQEITTMSFASDDNRDGPTFESTRRNEITTSGEVVLDLFVDRNEDTQGGLVKIQSYFKLSGNLYEYAQYPYGPDILHVWRVRGEITFAHVNPTTNETLFTIRFDRAVLTSVTPMPDHVGGTMTLQVSEFIDPNMSMTPDTLLNGIGVDLIDLLRSESMAITFTNIKVVGTAAPAMHLVPIDPGSGDFHEPWTAEGSFSCSGDRH